MATDEDKKSLSLTYLIQNKIHDIIREFCMDKETDKERDNASDAAAALLFEIGAFIGASVASEKEIDDVVQAASAVIRKKAVLSYLRYTGLSSSE